MAFGTPKNVCLMGHSFIRRVDEYMQKNGKENLKLYRHLFEVSVKTQGGLTMSRMGRSRMYTEFSVIPDICFIHIGENDLDILDLESATSQLTQDQKITKLVDHICSFVEYLLVGIGVRRVVVGQLLRRQLWAIKTPTFNEDVIAANQRLEERLLSIEGAHFWHHRGFWDSYDFLGRDGVHINNSRTDSRHMNKYLQSIKCAVLWAANH